MTKIMLLKWDNQVGLFGARDENSNPGIATAETNLELLYGLGLLSSPSEWLAVEFTVRAIVELEPRFADIEQLDLTSGMSDVVTYENQFGKRVTFLFSENFTALYDTLPPFDITELP